MFQSIFIADPLGISASFLLNLTTLSFSFSFSVLAAWFRLKYPHIAVGALASSAPILQFDDITPWSSFYDAVSQDFKVYKLFSPLACWSLSYIYVSSGSFPSPISWNCFFGCVFFLSERIFNGFEQEASLNCFKVIKGSWRELEAMSAKKGGLAEISKIFRTCK